MEENVIQIKCGITIDIDARVRYILYVKKVVVEKILVNI